MEERTMYSNTARSTPDVPRNPGEAVHGIAAVTVPVHAAIRRAERMPHVRHALAAVHAAGTLGSSPIRRPAREPFETDGPATCLI
jgi:hypothetical protein